MSDFLLELRSEEIPARMQAGARADLEKLFRDAIRSAGLEEGSITVWSTPRRLALVATGLQAETATVTEEVKGPRVGAPPQALEGFLRKTGLTEDQLVERDGVLFAITEKPGRATAEVLAEAIPAIVRAFPWPKSQRWGAASISTESLRWVRPLSAIVALFDGQVVDCEVGGIKAGRLTKGHRFHSGGEISIDGADDYAGKLRAAHVIVDHTERQDLIRSKASEAAAAAGLKLVEDEGLVIENAGLTEWPVPLLGRFDEAFLEVPPEVIQLTARTNQKYFVCEDAAGKLANAFVCTANIDAADGGAAIVAGNRKVLAARLSDARFFWEQDRKTALSDHAKKLERITFHEKLGTVADKVERVAKLARWLVEEGIVSPLTVTPDSIRGPAALATADEEAGPRVKLGVTKEELADQAELAARLCKADLVTEMVGEFPELQGLMGGYYARAEGLSDAVADAIRDHYKPVGQGDEVPTAPVTVAVALADKLDTLAAFFFKDLKPSGSKDPFALRRAALAVISTCLENSLRLPLRHALVMTMEHVVFAEVTRNIEGRYDELRKILEREKIDVSTALRGFRAGAYQAAIDVDLDFMFDQPARAAMTGLRAFFIDRLKVQQREAGVRHDLIDAVFALGDENDLVRLLARVHALQSFIGTEDGANLLAGYKRAANILKKEGITPNSHPGLVPGQGWGPDAAQQESTAPGQARGDLDEVKIPRDGEEDPFAMVDDPDVAHAMRERIAVQKELSYTPEPAEKALIDALDQAGPAAAAAAAVAAEDFAAAMAALASLRAPIDAFFESVTVNDADAAKRTNRLSLLARFRDAVHGVADFSRIEG